MDRPLTKPRKNWRGKLKKPITPESLVRRAVLAGLAAMLAIALAMGIYVTKANDAEDRADKRQQRSTIELIHRIDQQAAKARKANCDTTRRGILRLIDEMVPVFAGRNPTPEQLERVNQRAEPLRAGVRDELATCH